MANERVSHAALIEISRTKSLTIPHLHLKKERRGKPIRRPVSESLDAAPPTVLSAASSDFQYIVHLVTPHQAMSVARDASRIIA